MSFLGLFVMLGLAWLLSNNKRKIDFRVILGGLSLQFILAASILKSSLGQMIFEYAKDGVTTIINLSDKGAVFLFGDNFADHFFAFKVLPTIIFVSSLSYLLFYFGVMQKVVSGIAWLMKKTMNISGSEGLVTAANIFCGQTEAPLFVKPYLKTMTRAEIHTMMTGGMATAAGGVLAAYVGFGVSAGHLLAASLMSAPAAIVISRIIYPELEESPTKGQVAVALEIPESNAFEAACTGAADGLKLALNVGAMLIAFISLVALFNLGLGKLGTLVGFDGLSLELILGRLFQPLAYFMGIPWDESFMIAQFLGEKMVLNEFIAYVHLMDHAQLGELSERSVTIATYALCGFANFSSIAIQIGGMGALEPSRKRDFAACGFKSMLGGTLAAFSTACVAGILVP
ncbi:MAG: NupC/NupG family nucleoside CNT transporter [Oligoflexales bacterium]|nr:NupC/NupG family nucleoside CNT transporter [Oligoflexales bacterium]